MTEKVCGRLREVTRKLLISLCGRLLREVMRAVREVTCKLLIYYLRLVCGGCGQWPPPYTPPYRSRSLLKESARRYQVVEIRGEHPHKLWAARPVKTVAMAAVVSQEGDNDPCHTSITSATTAENRMTSVILMSSPVT
jgi:hypothetical protein